MEGRVGLFPEFCEAKLKLVRSYVMNFVKSNRLDIYFAFHLHHKTRVKSHWLHLPRIKRVEHAPFPNDSNART